MASCVIVWETSPGKVYSTWPVRQRMMMQRFTVIISHSWATSEHLASISLHLTSFRPHNSFDFEYGHDCPQPLSKLPGATKTSWDGFSPFTVILRKLLCLCVCVFGFIMTTCCTSPPIKRPRSEVCAFTAAVKGAGSSSKTHCVTMKGDEYRLLWWIQNEAAICRH